VDETIEDHQCGFRRNRSTTDKILCICRLLEENWEYSETVHQLFIVFKRAHDSVRREALYNILIEFVISIKVVRLINLYLNETCTKVRIGRHLSDTFPFNIV
jgi:hypothetical protein